MVIQCLSCLADNPDKTLICQFCGSWLATSEELTQTSPLYLAPGTLLCQGKYKVEKFLGQGGFGIAYKGFDLINQKAIAIKEYCPENSGRKGTEMIWASKITPQQRQKEIQDIKNEVSRLQKCLHQNIVKAHVVFEENNTIYIIMDFIEGKSLLKILEEKGKLPESQVKKYFLQIAEALKVIHQNQILHKDIKPDNIIINTSDRPILLDFGSSREFISDKTQKHTRIFSPGYAPYEQFLSTTKLSPATDIYAVCASMYELLTGELPPSALDRKVQDDLQPLKLLVPTISPPIEQAILTGLNIEAKDRFQSIDEFIDALTGKFVSPSQRRARLLVEQGKLLEAVQVYEQCLVKEPNNGQAVVELALVQTYVNDFEAEVAAQKAIQLQPSDGRGYGVLGLVNCRKGNWLAAVQYLQQAANLSPNQSWIQANLAWALAKSRKWQDAEIAVTKAIQLDSNSTFTLGLQAWIATHQQQWKPAISAARQAITKSKQTDVISSQGLQRWVYPCLTIALDKAVITQQARDVERCIQEFITQVPESAFVWGFKAWKQAAFGFWANALSDLEQAQHKPQLPNWVLINLGITYERLQNLQRAIQVYEDCDRQFPPDSFTLFRLGTLLGRQQQWSQARSHLEKAVHLKPDYAEAFHNLAWILFHIKGKDGQVENFREMWSAYHQAIELYTKQQKYPLAQNIKQAFQAIGVEL